MNDEENRQEEQEEVTSPEPDPKDAQIESLTQQLKAAKADLYNFRQRTIKERQETRKRATEDIITSMLPVLDTLGVSIIKAQGENFDPMLHDAAGTEHVDDPELDGKVITERLKGYRTKDRVLRPAQVTVGKA